MAEQGGFGLVVKIEVAGVMTAVANLLDADYPEFDKVLASKRAHGSAGGYDTFVATGARSMGEFKMTLSWDVASSTHAALLAGYDSDSTVNMSIQDPDSAEVISFAAHIKKIGRVSKQTEGYKCTITVQPDGLPTITP